LPKTVAGLIDDPFRSLAGELRRAGGFAKDTTPFSEFLWTDFLRRRVKRLNPPRRDHISRAGSSPPRFWPNTTACWSASSKWVSTVLPSFASAAAIQI
jgi:hypothetical protein